MTFIIFFFVPVYGTIEQFDPSKSNRSLKEKEAEATGLSTSSIDTPDFNPPLSPRSMAGNKSIAPSTKSVMKSANWTGEREPL